MATIGTLLISLKAGTANFDKKMKKSARRIDKFVSSLKRGGRRLALFGAAIAAARNGWGCRWWSITPSHRPRVALRLSTTSLSLAIAATNSKGRG